MKSRIPVAFGILALTLTACKDGPPSRNEEVISKRYVHRYGYDVSPKEWESQELPGSVITTQRDGATIVQTYEAGILHGETTESYAHSQTIKVRKLFDKGILSKQTFYDVRGVPEREEVFASPIIRKVTSWYTSGTPRSIEEFSRQELSRGEYFNPSNEVESTIETGTGVRTLRNRDGNLIGKEIFERSKVIKCETFHPNGTPLEMTTYSDGLLNGEKAKFGPNGAPIYHENWKLGKRHGITTLYQNGVRYAEVPFVNGKKHGIERQYIDGEVISEETNWIEDQRHGPSVAYCNGMTKTEYYFNNERVSKEKYNELLDREQQIATLNERGRNSKMLNFGTEE